VDQHKEERGLNRCLRATRLPKSTYYYRKSRPDGPSEDDQRLMRHIRAIIRDHPIRRNSCDGYRRILPELRARTGETVNHKRLRKLLSEHELGLPRCLPKASPSPVQEILEEAMSFKEFIRSENSFGGTSESMNRAQFWAHHFACWRYSGCPDNVLVIRFEDWVHDFDTTLTRISDYVGVSPEPIRVNAYERAEGSLMDRIRSFFF
jgi:hypothetical protein